MYTWVTKSNHCSWRRTTRRGKRAERPPVIDSSRSQSLLARTKTNNSLCAARGRRVSVSFSMSMTMCARVWVSRRRRARQRLVRPRMPVQATIFHIAVPVRVHVDLARPHARSERNCSVEQGRRACARAGEEAESGGRRNASRKRFQKVESEERWKRTCSATAYTASTRSSAPHRLSYLRPRERRRLSLAQNQETHHP